MKDNRVRSGLRIPYDLNTWLIQEADKRIFKKRAYFANPAGMDEEKRNVGLRIKPVRVCTDGSGEGA